MTLTDDSKDSIKKLVNYSTLGLEMGLSVAIGIAFGYFLDRFFKTYPYLTIIFMLFGVAAAFKTIIVLLKKVQRENERDKNSRN